MEKERKKTLQQQVDKVQFQKQECLKEESVNEISSNSEHNNAHPVILLVNQLGLRESEVKIFLAKRN
jgi:hypothetical protein